MTHEFIAGIKQVVFEAAVTGTEHLLLEPPGSAPTKGLTDLSRWFNGLAPGDRSHVLAVAHLAADGAVFGMLCVIDGSRKAMPDAQGFYLDAVDGAGKRTPIADGQSSLHEEYRAAVPPFGMD